MKKFIEESVKKSVKDLSDDIQVCRNEIAIARLEKKITTKKDTNIISKKRKQLAILLTLRNSKTENKKIK